MEEEPLPVVLDGVDRSSSHLLSDVERRYRFTEGGYFDWPEAAFPEERRLCLSVELGLPARSLYEKTSPSWGWRG